MHKLSPMIYESVCVRACVRAFVCVCEQGSMSTPQHGRIQRLYCVRARQRLEDGREADDRGRQAFQPGGGLENKRFQFEEGVIIG